MAYVRKTETLIDDIVRNVRKMKDNALSHYNDSELQPDTPEYNAMLDAVQASAYAEAPELRGKLPTSWLKEKERIRVKYKSTDGTAKWDTLLEAKSGHKFTLPAHLDSGYYAAEVSINDEHCNDIVRQWVNSKSERAVKRIEISEQYNTVERQLVAYMRGHASLNAAIKDMPEIEMYVPNKYMEKLREATAPREKKPQQQSLVDDLQIDRDALASIAIAHRITSAAE